MPCNHVAESFVFFFADSCKSVVHISFNFFLKSKSFAQEKIVVTFFNYFSSMNIDVKQTKQSWACFFETSHRPTFDQHSSFFVSKFCTH